MAKMTPLQRQYKAAYKNVMKRVTKLESQGFVFNQAKLPKMRKTATTAGLQHLKKFTEAYLKNMPSTRFRVSPTKVTTGAKGAEIIASGRSKKAVTTRRKRERKLTHAEENQMSRDFQKSLLDTKHKGDDRFDQDYYDYRDEVVEAYNREQLETERREEAFDDAFITGESNYYYHVSPEGEIFDTDTGEIVYVPPALQFDRGDALVDGLDNLISEYEQSDNRWVREKAGYLRDSLDSTDRETLADNLGHMSADFISYVQTVVEESGGNQNEVNNNYAKLTEIQALIEGRTLEMGSLRESFVD